MNRLVLLAGGRSTEHDASIHSYENVAAEVGDALDDLVQAVVFVDREGGCWLHGDVPRTLKELVDVGHARALDPGEVIAVLRRGPVFSLLFGKEGEDGAWQGVAEVFDLQGNFGSIDAAALTMHKFAFCATACALDGRIRMPDSRLVETGGAGFDVEATLAWLGGRRCIVKPNSSGASLFLRVVEPDDPAGLVEAVRAMQRYERRALVQEHVEGVEYTVGVYEREGSPVVLPVIRADYTGPVLGHAEKHGRDGVRAQLVSDERTDVLREIAMALFQIVGLRLWCRFDFRWPADSEQVVLLEANSMPGLMRGSAYPLMLERAGLGIRDLLEAMREAPVHPTAEKVLHYDINPHDVATVGGTP